MPAPLPVRLRRRGGDAGPAAEAGVFGGCAAPSIQLRFDPNGVVTTCCKTLQPLGDIRTDRLPAIWSGELRRRMVAALAVDDYSVGCQRCAAEIDLEGREVSYPAIYDEWARHLTGDPASAAWPVRMEMNLSNACNLQCIQCDGDSSSSIRLHREGRPPLPKVYGDTFFEDLIPFLPHLDRIMFAGGEPFLGAENYRVWELIAEHAPHIDCQVVTNATLWTPRIESLLDRLRFSFVFSLDGITASTYEAIRIGADFERVMANVERFTAYARRIGTSASINHCLMPANVHEFGDLLVWAEQRELPVSVSVVRFPSSASLAALDPGALARIHEALVAQDPVIAPQLVINRAPWDRELARIGAWASSAHDTRASGAQTIMFFQCGGSGPSDDGAARRELEPLVPDGRIDAFTIGRGDLVTSCDAPHLPGADRLVGCTVNDVTHALTARFGEMGRYQVRSTSADRVDAEVAFGDRAARVTSVAIRDARGWADEVRLLVAFTDRVDDPLS